MTDLGNLAQWMLEKPLLTPREFTDAELESAEEKGDMEREK